MLLLPIVGFFAWSFANSANEQETKAIKLQKLAESIFDSSREAFLIADSSSQVVMVNNAYRHITGYASEDVVGKSLTDVYCLSKITNWPIIWKECLQNRGWAGNVISYKKGGEPYSKHLSIDAIYSEDKIDNYIVKFFYIMDSRRIEAELLHLASYDDLTGLPNKRFMTQILENMIADSENPQFAVMFVDIDNFKTVNNTHGHAFGDACLKAFALSLRSMLRQTDFVSRYSGDQFVVLLNCANRMVCSEVTRKIMQQLSTESLRIVSQETRQEVSFTLLISVGIALSNEHGSTSDELLTNSYTALCEAKRKGKANFRIFDPNLLDSDMELYQTLVESIADNMRGFYLMYQPQVRLSDNTITGYEALLRFTTKDGKKIPPDVFIPVLENNNMITKVGTWVLQQACAQFALRKDLFVAVNVSMHQLTEDFLELVHNACLSVNFDPNMLEIEVTESVFGSEVQATVLLHKLRDIGNKIAIDDFGSGYSSLSRLLRLPVNKLKIDGLFMRTFDENMAVISSIIAIGKSLDLEVIAEGVETEKQLEHLSVMGCDSIQGYVYSKPVLIVDVVFSPTKTARGNQC